MYRVDGEIGRFKFKTHRITDDNTTAFDTSKDIFRTLYSKEWYRTQGFNELAFALVVDESYRKADKKLNRIRREEDGGTPIRTLANMVEIEGNKLNEYINDKAADILEENEFTIDGIPKSKEQEYLINIEQVRMDESILEAAIDRYNRTQPEDMKIDPQQRTCFYEKSNNTVNISIDDVGVKKQVEHRQKGEDKNLKYVRNTIVHIEKGKEKYFLNGASTTSVLIWVIAFLLHNRLVNCYLQFFVDGERTLHSAILNKFSWHKYFRIVLDWYHLKKKCETELSLAMRGRDIRNTTLSEILKYLWIGKIDDAIKILQNINSDYIKCDSNINRLIQYLERNREYIPCYALRKELGLRNSSNKGEKTNDLIVSERQKHNGMSWSKEGTVALATVTTLHLNNELHKWFAKGTIDFKLVG